MSAKHDLQHSIMNVTQHNRDGSYNTQVDRQRILNQIAAELTSGGYKLRHVNALKQKHVRYLNEQWQEKGLSSGTIKNRNAALRWLCKKLNKRDLMPSNDAMGIERRVHVTNINKAIDLTDELLSKISNPRVLVQLQLQRHFGLRREEAIKIQPHFADRGDHIFLQASWCKGGRSRTVPISSKEARYWLDEAKKLAGTKQASLIESDKTYKQAKEIYNKQLQRAGIHKAHGLRHQYAQEQYELLSSISAPVAGGPKKSSLSQDQKLKSDEARMEVSEALGHSRLNITSVYLGGNK